MCDLVPFPGRSATGGSRAGGDAPAGHAELDDGPASSSRDQLSGPRLKIVGVLSGT
jgi:hypothetical protein